MRSVLRQRHDLTRFLLALVSGFLLGWLSCRQFCSFDCLDLSVSTMRTTNLIEPSSRTSESPLKAFLSPMNQGLKRYSADERSSVRFPEPESAVGWQAFLEASGDTIERSYGDREIEGFGALLSNLDFFVKEICEMLQPLHLTGSVQTQLKIVTPLIQTAMEAIEAAHRQVLAEAKRVTADFQKQVKKLSVRQTVASWAQLFLDSAVTRQAGNHKLAVVVPIRNRDQQTELFQQAMPDFLLRKGVPFHIFFVEQSEDGRAFNRAKLLNVGYKLASLDFDYFAFHDVDMLPVFDTVEYAYPIRPTHLSTCVEQFKWGMPYGGYFGGVSLISRHHMRVINGLSNRYWGWGGEDDDFALRLELVGLTIARSRPFCERGIFRSISQGHTERVRDPQRTIKLDYAKMIMWADGLNSLSFSVLNASQTEHWSRILVRL